MPLDPTTQYPLAFDTFSAPGPTDKLGTTNKEGDLVIRELQNALTATQNFIGLYGQGLDAAANGVRVAWSPTLLNNGATCPNTLTGSYCKRRQQTDFLMKLAATGAWSGSPSSPVDGTPVVEFPLPPGVTTDANFESANVGCFLAPKPNIGVHFPIIGVGHPNGTRLRLITPVQQDIDLIKRACGYSLVDTAGLWTRTAHGLNVGDKVQVSPNTLSFPSGFNPGGTYFVIASGFTANVFKLSATAGGAAIVPSASGSADIFAMGAATTLAQWFAFNGIGTPFQFTGDGGGTLDDELHIVGTIYHQ